jgi:hypothetical protein
LVEDLETHSMPKTNVVTIRDERGRYLKGMPGGPGRALGSRNRLREDFLADMHAAWLEHGPDVIDRLIVEWPEIFLMAMLKIAQLHRVEFDRPDPPPSEEEALQRLEQRAGPKARKMLEDFLAKVEKLER